jgi:hypothetical protein
MMTVAPDASAIWAPKLTNQFLHELTLSVNCHIHGNAASTENEDVVSGFEGDRSMTSVVSRQRRASSESLSMSR